MTSKRVDNHEHAIRLRNALSDGTYLEVVAESIRTAQEAVEVERATIASLTAENLRLREALDESTKWRSKPQYEPVTLEQALAYFVEEAGEVLAAIGKSQRWGLESYNPELPQTERETNRQWILRELDDVLLAGRRLRAALNPTGEPK